MGSKRKAPKQEDPEVQEQKAKDRATVEANENLASRRRNKQSTVLANLTPTTALSKTNTGL